MRGLIVTNLFPSNQEPSRAMYNLRQFSELSRHHDLHVIVISDQTSSGDKLELPDGLTATYVQKSRLPLVGRFLNPKVVERLVLSHLPIQERKDYDYVLGSFGFPEGVAATKVAQSIGVPGFVKFHGSDLNVLAEQWPYRGNMIKSIQRAQGVITVSDALTDKVNSLVPATRVLRIYNGVDVVQAQVEPERDRVIYVGNLKRTKGVFDLLDAVATLRNAHQRDVCLDVVGDGPDRDELITYCQRQGLAGHTVFHGAVLHTQISQMIQNATLLCLPSYNEGVPNVLLEAMANGRPYVATNVGGVPEIHASECGELVSPGDTAALAQAILVQLEKKVCPKAIRSKVQRFSWQENVEQLKDFIETAHQDIPQEKSVV